MNEASCSVIGGHSIRNEDMLYGYRHGSDQSAALWRNVGAREAMRFCSPTLVLASSPQSEIAPRSNH